MQSVRYVERAPVYGDKGNVVASGVVQHTVMPASHSPAKEVLLDTRISYKQPEQQHPIVDKESLSMQQQTVRAYETKGDERLDRGDSFGQQQPGAIVHQMQKPLPSIPPPAVVQSSELIGRSTSESEPQYVTVYEDGAQLFSPRTINLLGTAARLPPPPPPAAEQATPTSTMQFPAAVTAATTVAPTATATPTRSVTVEQTTTTVRTQPIQPAQPTQPIQPTQPPAPIAVKQPAQTAQTSQPVGAVAVPSWPPAESEHNLAATKRVVEASTVREESPLMAGVEKPQPSPLLVSAGPQPYELPHPKNAIDVVQLPPPQPVMPVNTVETVASNTVPLPLLPPTLPAAPVTAKPAPAPQALPAPVVSTATVPALPAPRPSLPQTAYEQAQPRAKPTTVPAPVRAAPRRQWKMPRLFDVLLSPWAIGLYVLAGLLLLFQLPFWLLVTMVVALDAAVIAYRRPVKQQSTALVPYVPRPLSMPAPAVSSASTALALPAPKPSTALIVSAPSSAPDVPALVAARPSHAQTTSRDFGTQYELMEEHEEAMPVPRSPAEFFKAIRQQHGGSPPASSDRTAARQAAVPVMNMNAKKLAPSARQQATVPLLADAQNIAPEGVILSDHHDEDASTTTAATTQHNRRQVDTPQRYVHPVPHEQPNSLPTPSGLPNPMLDALNSASPRRELNDLTHAVDKYNDMQPETALAPQVQVAARRGVAGIPTSDAAAAVQGASNPVVMVPTWPPTEQQHEVAQARQVVEASTVRNHSVLLDDTDSSMHAPANSQPYEMVAVPHSTTFVNQTGDMMALPAPKGPVSASAPLALPFPTAPSFRVSANDVAHDTSATIKTPAVQSAAPTSQPALVAGEPARSAVKRLVSEEKEEAVVADVGEPVSVSDVGAGITQESGSRLRNIASHVHSQ